jgi:hypothetical protein
MDSRFRGNDEREARAKALDPGLRRDDERKSKWTFAFVGMTSTRAKTLNSRFRGNDKVRGNDDVRGNDERKVRRWIPACARMTADR